MKKLAINCTIVILFLLPTLLMFGCGPSPLPEPKPAPSPTPEPTPTTAELEVHFIDVGQGDAILIDLEETEVLIDGGDKTPGVVEYLIDYIDGTLELMVATHPHADHIGGLIAVLDAFEVEEIWLNGDTSTSETYSQFMSSVNSEGAQVYEARRGDTIEVGELVFSVLHPVNLDDTINNNSIVLSLGYGEIDFLFMGDAEQKAEASMLAEGIVPDVEILKVGHHGSRTASSRQFLQVAKPDCAIYMAKEGNRYDHPHEESITALNEVGAEIYGTDIHGTIIITTDGDTYTLQLEKQAPPRAPPVVSPAPVPTPTPEEIDMEAVAKAKEDIEKYRKGDVTLIVVDAQGQPCSGLAVEYAQTEHSFLFGIFCRSNDGRVWSLMREAGLNYGPVQLDWGRLEHQRGRYDLGADRTRFLRQFGFAAMGHSLIWLTAESIVPEYVFALSYEELKDAFYHHIYRVVQRYKQEIKIWNIANEPMMTQENLLGLSEQETIAVIREGSQAIRDADPEARIMINVWPPGGENRNPSQRGIYPYDFLRDTIESGVDFDIIGLECYYNAYVRETLGRHPRRSLSSIGELIDKYSTLGKNIQITEISVPSEAIGEGYWGQPWSQELQAEYLKAIYTIFFSKPQVEAITWWNATDKPLRSHPFIYHGGLLDEENQPKKSYHALKDLIKSWTTIGTGVTDKTGQVSFRGFGGTYEVVVSDPESGLSKRQEITVEEQKDNIITIVLD